MNKRFFAKEVRGITLIALIITIIVLLILAGVTIAAISGNESVLNKAQEAKNKTDISSAKEAAMLKATEYIQDYYQGKFVENNEEYAEAGDYVAKQFETQFQSGNYYIKTDTNSRYIKVSLDASQSNVIVEGTIDDDGIITWVTGSIEGKTTSSSNRTLAGTTTGYSSKNPVIPQGFKAVDVGRATWEYTDNTNTIVSGWNNGLVIEDVENQNQFVWVPCTTASNNNVATSGIVSYAKNFDSYPKNSNITSVSDASDSNAIPVTETTQIGIYGGFYVARFEAGLSNPSSNSSNNSVATPISKAGTKVWNNVSYNTSYNSANSMINNSTKYGNNKSGLITGTQWDTIMKWYENSNIGVLGSNQDWGTYKDITYTVRGDYFTYTGSANAWQTATSDLEHTANSDTASESNPRVYHASGLNSDGYQKNIADLGGNLWEWTAEATTVNSSSHRVNRGGSAYNAVSSNPASYRNSNDPSNLNFSIRFPCRALYSVALNTEFT